ncbi:MAG: hypothetical protein Q8J74_07310, partial [Candidatus Didemnitutus sp.]|nr:hypothetical protein [Candidatus Didemnitutus sp.]
MTSLRFFASLLLAVGAAHVGMTQGTPIRGLYGELKGSHYVAPENRYRIAVPVLPELGGHIFDTENVVTFSDDVSIYISIACFPLDMTTRWERDTRGIKEFLSYFFGQHVMPNFVQRFPGATNELSLFTPDIRDGALLVFTLLPGGSSFAAQGNVLDLPSAAPIVAKRGNLLFVQNDHIFILSTELAERVTQRSVFHKTPEEENEMLRTRLVELANRLHLPAPKPKI